MNRPLILLTNDDGIAAEGLAALAEAMRALGEVVVVAPQEEQSAMGHAISVKKSHALRPFERDGRLFGYGFDAAPADCVKFAVTRWLKERPALVVSGINPGPNFGTNVPYSGTVAAALEAAILGLPSIAVSTSRPGQDGVSDFASAARAAMEMGRIVLQDGIAAEVALNVNAPALPGGEIRGYRVAPVGQFRVQDHFFEIEPAEDGARQWSNIGADLVYSPEGLDADDAVFNQGYVALTPLTFDMTARNEMEAWRRRIEKQ